MKKHFLVVSLLLALAGTCVFGQNPPGAYSSATSAGGGVVGGTFGGSPSSGYTFSVSAGTVSAVNNKTGVVNFSGSDAAVVINAAIAANATTGGRLFFKNGIYNLNSMTLEGGCTNFGGSGNTIAYGINFPANTIVGSVQWLIEGESTTVWQGEEGSTTVNNSGVVFNVTSTGVSSVAAGSILNVFWQRPTTSCTLQSLNITNDVHYKNITVRFPTNTRGNEIGINAWFNLNVEYENVVADFNLPYNTIATGSAPAVGSYGSFGLTSTVSSSGNYQYFRNTFSTGYNIAYDFQSEHIVGETVTAIYSNFACEFGRSGSAIFHPNWIAHFVDQENGAGCIWGPQVNQGSMTDIGFDFEFGGDANWYSTARNSLAKLSEVNCNYGTGIIRYQAVLGNAGIVAELPAVSLFTTCGAGFQEFEATQNPNIALTPVLDSFTRPNSTTTLGPTWVTVTNFAHTGIITSNAATHFAAQNSAGYYAAQPFNTDQSSGVTVATIDASGLGVLTNVQNGVQSYYEGLCTSAARSIVKVIATVSTTLITAASGCQAADIIEFNRISNPDGTVALYFYITRAGVTTFQTFSEPTSILTGGNPGIIIANGADSVTNWRGGSLPTKTGVDSIYARPALFPTYSTLTNCAGVGTAASPSVASCGSASAGHFSCATNATGATCQVNTTAVTANSEILVFESDTTVTGTALGVTCNTSTTVNPATRLLASSIAATSFTINLGTVTTNPACFSYEIKN
jgi:hypothetical protein